MVTLCVCTFLSNSIRYSSSTGDPSFIFLFRKDFSFFYFFFLTPVVTDIVYDVLEVPDLWLTSLTTSKSAYKPVGAKIPRSYLVAWTIFNLSNLVIKRVDYWSI